MRRGPNAHVPTAVDYVWRMGGRVCDLPAETLDSLATWCRSVKYRPVAIDEAQRQMDAYTERYQPDAGEVASC